MIPDGKYIGLEAVIFKPAALFPFMKLPPELRMMIYRLVVGHIPETVFVTRKRHSTLRCFAPYKKNAVALLAVSRQINLEARPILYYDTTFDFLDQDQAVMFLNKFPGSVRFLERIEVSEYILRTYLRTTMFRKLKAADNLKSLTIYMHRSWSDRYWKVEDHYADLAAHFLKSTTSFIKSWHKLKGDKSTDFPALDILEFVPPPSYMSAWAAFDQASLKAEMRRRLTSPKGAATEAEN